MQRPFAWAALAAASVLALGCGQSNGGGTGAVQVALISTGAPNVLRPPITLPPPLVPHLDVTVLQVAARFKPASVVDNGEGDDGNDVHGALGNGHGDMGDMNDDRGEGDDGDRGAWTVLFSGSDAMSLADGAGSQVVLGSTTVPSGEITGVRVMLADSAVLTFGDTRIPLTCNACDTAGIRLASREKLFVPAGETLGIDLVFNLSLAQPDDGDDGFDLGPLVTVQASVLP